MKMKPIESRRELIAALAIAAELEHSLSCQYQFAAFSLRPWIDDPTHPERREKARSWASTLLLVAREEMEHLGMVFNLLTAVGGAPRIRRPNFPFAGEHYDQLPPFELLPFSAEAVDRFIRCELPESVQLRQTCVEHIRTVSRFPAAAKGLLEIIRSETNWEYGAAGVVSESGGLHFICETKLSHPGIKGTLLAGKHFEAGLYANSPIMQSLNDRYLPRGYALSDDAILRECEGIDAAGFRSAVTIPIRAPKGIVLVLVFGYATFGSAGEDDLLVDVVDAALHEGDDDKKRIPYLLSEFPEYTPESSHPEDPDLLPRPFHVQTIGGLYRRIRKGIIRLSASGNTLFIGQPGAQVSNLDIGLPPRSFHNVDLGEVNFSQPKTALAMIDRIVETGEGANAQDMLTHYERFCRIRDEMDTRSLPALNVASNPATFAREGAIQRIEGALALQTAQVFNAAYEIMLVMLARYFASDDDREVKTLGHLLYKPLMGMVLRQLGEALTCMPMRDEDADAICAGAPFELYDDLDAFPGQTVMWTVFLERVEEMAAACDRIIADEASGHDAVEQLRIVHQSLASIALRVRQYVEGP